MITVSLCRSCCCSTTNCCFFFFSSRRRHTRSKRDWSSDVCSSDLRAGPGIGHRGARAGGRPHAGGQRRQLVLDRAQRNRDRLPTRGRLDENPRHCRARSEERRVGKECRSRGSPYHLKKKRQYITGCAADGENLCGRCHIAAVPWPARSRLSQEKDESILPCHACVLLVVVLANSLAALSA